MVARRRRAAVARSAGRSLHDRGASQMPGSRRLQRVVSRRISELPAGTSESAERRCSSSLGTTVVRVRHGRCGEHTRRFSLVGSVSSVIRGPARALPIVRDEHGLARRQHDGAVLLVTGPLGCGRARHGLSVDLDESCVVSAQFLHRDSKWRWQAHRKRRGGPARRSCGRSPAHHFPLQPSGYRIGGSAAGAATDGDGSTRAAPGA